MRIKILKISLVASALMLSGCGTIEIDSSEEAPSELNSDELVALVNEARRVGQYCGDEWFPSVDDIEWNMLIEEAAQIHSDDMDQNDFFEHQGSDGSSAGDRLQRVGYSWSTYGENIAHGYVTEESAVEGWLDSPGHCRNIMNGDFAQMGVATKGFYWTQVFAKSK